MALSHRAGRRVIRLQGEVDASGTASFALEPERLGAGLHFAGTRHREGQTSPTVKLVLL